MTNSKVVCGSGDTELGPLGLPFTNLTALKH